MPFCNKLVGVVMSLHRFFQVFGPCGSGTASSATGTGTGTTTHATTKRLFKGARGRTISPPFHLTARGKGMYFVSIGEHLVCIFGETPMCAGDKNKGRLNEGGVCQPIFDADGMASCTFCRRTMPHHHKM